MKMFFIKGKIRRYLEQKAEDKKSAFDLLLRDYTNGSMKQRIYSAGIRKISIHVDWLEDIKCIGIQGRFNEYCMDVQIYQDEFGVSFDSDEPDEDILYPIEDREQIYNVIFDTVKQL
jgi:hypothetical protein